MKPKEAIDTLKALSAAVEWDFPLDYAAAIDAAIEALEKQVPEKAEKCIGFGDYWYQCPNCHEKLGVKKRYAEMHCRFCGQEICWEGE